MIVMPSNHSSPIVHYWAGKGYPIGWLVGPSAMKKTKFQPWMPFAIDNDAFSAWTNKEPWDEVAFFTFLDFCKLKQTTPLWVLVPDVVGERDATLRNWDKYASRVAEYGWPLAFACQDGMTVKDIPGGAHVAFIGGTTQWKWRNVEGFCKEFPRIHVGRVNTMSGLWLCDGWGVESVDGTGWFRDGQDAYRFRRLEKYFLRQKEPTLFDFVLTA